MPACGKQRIGQLLAAAFLLWWVPSVGLLNIHPLLPVLFGTLLSALALVIVGGLSLLILTLLSGRDLFFSDRLRGIVVRYLFPAIIGLGRHSAVDLGPLPIHEVLWR